MRLDEIQLGAVNLNCISRISTRLSANRISRYSLNFKILKLSTDKRDSYRMRNFFKNALPTVGKVVLQNGLWWNWSKWSRHKSSNRNPNEIQTEFNPLNGTCYRTIATATSRPNNKPEALEVTRAFWIPEDEAKRLCTFWTFQRNSMQTVACCKCPSCLFGRTSEADLTNLLRFEGKIWSKQF